MKALISSLTALAFIATPAVAAQTQPTSTMSKTMTTKKASPQVVKHAKAEHESVATEAKEHRAAVRHHARRRHESKCSPSGYARHSMKHKTSHKTASTAAKKSTSTPSTKTSG